MVVARRGARWMALALGSVAYSLLFGEMFLRLLQPQPLMPRYVTAGRDGVRANMPGVAFRQSTPEVDVLIRYNSAGMRDDRPPPLMAKGPEQCRVVLLGDSYFVGFESDYPHSFAKQLEDRLRDQGLNCRVLNFAVSGFGTAEMLVALQHRALSYHPDLVIMSWHLTDPVDNIRSGLFNLDNDCGLVRGAATYLPGIKTSDKLMAYSGYRWLIQNSQLYSAVRERAGVFFKSLLAQSRFRAHHLEDEASGSDEEVSSKPGSPAGPRPGNPALDSALILRARDVARGAGSEFLLVDIPGKSSRTKFVSMFNWLPSSLLESVEVLDPVRQLEHAARPDLPVYLERGQRHWTATGNAAVAQVVALKSSSMIKRMSECRNGQAQCLADTSPHPGADRCRRFQL